MVADGLTNREIGAKLFISERTVDGHLEHIREKLGVNSRAQVTAWLIRSDSGQTPSAGATVPAIRPRSRLIVHPTAWLAGALVLGLLAATVGVLRLIEPPAPIIKTVVGCTTPARCLLADTQQPLAAALNNPTSIAVDSTGIIYIADFGHGRIVRVAGDVMTTIAGGGKEQLKEGAFGRSVSSSSLGDASTIAVDAQDELDVLTNRADMLELWRIDSAGFMHFVVLVGPGQPGNGYFFAPNLPVGGLAITRDGVIFISDRAGNRVWRYPPRGPVTLYAGGGQDRFGDGGGATSAQLNWPTALALDSQENLLIADTGNHRIRQVDHLKGTISTLAGDTEEFEGDRGDGGLAKRALLSFPMGVAVAPNGAVVIADTGNNRLREISAGTIAALAGTGQVEYLGDGQPAAQAGLNAPQALVLDHHGDLFILDNGNLRVREIPHLFGSG